MTARSRADLNCRRRVGYGATGCGCTAGSTGPTRRSEKGVTSTAWPTARSTPDSNAAGHNAWCDDLHEGKNREVRKVLEHLGLPVTRLIRLSFGPFQLGNLARGEIAEVPKKVLAEQLGKAVRPMRIVGGRHRGRRLLAPAGEAVRPTAIAPARRCSTSSRTAPSPPTASRLPCRRARRLCRHRRARA